MPVNRQEASCRPGGRPWPFWLFASLAVLAAFLPFLLQAAGTQPPGLEPSIRDAVRRPSTYIDARVLAANTAETVTAPTFTGTGGTLLVGVFSATCSNWYYNETTTAAAPAADVTDGGGAGRAPVALKMAQANTFSIVADATCIVTIEWYLERGI